MSPWFHLAPAIVSEVVGTTTLKDAEGFSRGGPTLIAAGVADVVVINIFSRPIVR